MHSSTSKYKCNGSPTAMQDVAGCISANDVEAVALSVVVGPWGNIVQAAGPAWLSTG